MAHTLQRSLIALTACVGLIGAGGCQRETAQEGPDMAYLTATPPPISDKGDLFPVRNGTRWVIQRSMGSGAATTESVVTGTRIVGATKGIVIETRSNGKAVQQEVYSVDRSGVKRLATGPMGQVVLDPPMPLLRYPVRNGDAYSWHGALRAGGKSTPATAVYAVTGPERLTVRDHSYNTYRLEVQLTLRVNGRDEPVPFSMWFAPNMGVVKQESGVLGRQITSELERMIAAS